MLTFEEIIPIITDSRYNFWYKRLLGENLSNCVVCTRKGDVYLMTKEGKNHLGLLCEQCIKSPRPYSLQKLEQEEVQKIRFLWNTIEC